MRIRIHTTAKRTKINNPSKLPLSILSCPNLEGIVEERVDLVKSDLANILRGIVSLREELGEPAQAPHQQVHGLARAQDLLPDGAAQLQHNTTLFLILLYSELFNLQFLKDAQILPWDGGIRWNK
jgi:hypothetical protein